MIFVDDFAMKHRGNVWYHLMSDNDTDEIHKFAQELGLKRSWYHVDHYDLTENKKNQAIRMGAKQISSIEMVNIRKAKRS